VHVPMCACAPADVCVRWCARASRGYGQGQGHAHAACRCALVIASFIACASVGPGGLAHACASEAVACQMRSSSGARRVELSTLYKQFDGGRSVTKMSRRPFRDT